MILYRKQSLNIINHRLYQRCHLLLLSLHQLRLV
nr:MAG TPA: hypothetical protein [Caudoviricetes sp.]